MQNIRGFDINLFKIFRVRHDPTAVGQAVKLRFRVDIPHILTMNKGVTLCSRFELLGCIAHEGNEPWSGHYRAFFRHNKRYV